MKHKILAAAAALLALSMTGCTREMMQLAGLTQKPKETKNYVETLQSDPVDALTLELKNATGCLDIQCGSGKKADIRVECKVEAGSQQVIEDCIAHMNVKAESDNQVFRLCMTEKESGRDFDKWVQSNYGNAVSVSADFYVTLPKDICTYNIENGVGTIDISNAEGVFNVQNGVGDITLQNAVVQNDSQFKTNIGSVELSPKSVSGNTSVSSDTGNIRLTFADKCTNEGSVSAKTAAGDIQFDQGQNTYSVVSEQQSGLQQTSTVKVADCCTVQMQTQAGSIRFIRGAAE